MNLFTIYDLQSSAAEKRRRGHSLLTASIAASLYPISQPQKRPNKLAGETYLSAEPRTCPLRGCRGGPPRSSATAPATRSRRGSTRSRSHTASSRPAGARAEAGYAGTGRGREAEKGERRRAEGKKEGGRREYRERMGEK